MAPSIIVQNVTIGGGLSFSEDICSFSDTQLEEFISTTLETIQQVLECPTDSDCQAEITELCEGQRRHLFAKRRLQDAGSWQLRFAITKPFTCEYSTCGAAADTAMTNSIIGGIKADMAASLRGDEFLTVLSQNIASDPGTLDTNILVCLAVWGTMDSQPILAVDPGENVYYPDWDGQTGTCLNDGRQPPYMMKNKEEWLYDSLEGCCERYYGVSSHILFLCRPLRNPLFCPLPFYQGWNMNKCLNRQGSGRWFVDYKSNRW